MGTPRTSSGIDSLRLDEETKQRAKHILWNSGCEALSKFLELEGVVIAEGNVPIKEGISCVFCGDNKTSVRPVCNNCLKDIQEGELKVSDLNVYE